MIDKGVGERHSHRTGADHHIVGLEHRQRHGPMLTTRRTLVNATCGAAVPDFPDLKDLPVLLGCPATNQPLGSALARSTIFRERSSAPARHGQGHCWSTRRRAPVPQALSSYRLRLPDFARPRATI